MNSVSSEQLRAAFAPGTRAHLVGIGGVSMSPLAEVLHGMGLIVTGSDSSESVSVLHLRSLGIPVTIGHFEETVVGADLVVRTAAVRDDNPEIRSARAHGIPVYERAQAWGALMLDYRNAVCVSGTHGKTTTTSMMTHIAMAAALDPTVMIGGTLPLLNAGHRVGKGDTIILESCEYCDSFLSFHPTVAIVLDVDADHLDYFKDLDAIKHSFRRFAELVPADSGIVVANADDANTVDAMEGIDRPVITYGMKNPADVTCANVTFTNGLAEFDVMFRGQIYTHIELQIPGIHNVSNALAASAASIFLGIPGEAVTAGLAGFRGAGRRFERKGEFNGADVYDDYAHHPGEMKALLDAVEPMGYNRVIVAFQPHTYTRTAALFDDFVEQLRRPDKVLLAEIYAAREQNTLGIHSSDLAAKVPDAESYETAAEVGVRLREIAQPGDLIITVGAGNIYQAGELLLSEN